MKYDLDRQIDRRHTGSLKWDRFPADVLPLWVADMDFAAPEPVVRALHERVEHGVFGYTLPPPELYEVIVARLEALYGWKVEAEDILFLSGVVPGFNLACRAFGEAGDEVLMQPPVYPPFLTAPSNAGRRCVYAPLRWDGRRYGIDFDEFERAVTPRTRLFILCNPHNPVGRVYEHTELERLAEICLRHGVVICADEIHCDLVFDGHRHLPIASLSPEVARRTITLMAPSKTFNIAGLHCSFAVIQNPELREAFLSAGAGIMQGVNLLGYVAALAAYRDGEEWHAQLMAYLEANRDFVHDYVERELPGVRMVVPEGTHLAWLDCREAGIPGRPGEFFLARARVALNEGESFGPGGEGFCRLNFACPRATLTEALERMRRALEGVAGG